MKSGKLRIIVSGMLAGDPFQGGATWAVLQYLLGLKQLGHAVTFIEPVSAAQLFVRPNRHVARKVELTQSDSASYFRSVTTEFGLGEDSALLVLDSKQTAGLSYDELKMRSRNCDLLINISGLLRDQALLEQIETRLFLDLDPAFNQIWASQGIDMGFDLHTHFATIGSKLGDPDCPVPVHNRKWIKTVPLVVLDRWPIAREQPRYGFTTIGNWRSYGSVEFNGTSYGLKAHSLRQFWSLPQRVDGSFELSLAIHPDETPDLQAFAKYGWGLVNPAIVADNPQHYREFIGSSQAEFAIAKEGYVKSSCGWLSDRSVCYLASGRPVLAQQTGFSEAIPTGEGLLAFSSIEDAAAGVEEITTNYHQHAKAARAIAETHFDSTKVLTRLLDAVAR